MRIAHLILAHNNPAQLARLIDRLQHPDADIYVHVDLKTAIEPFAALVTAQQTHFIKKRTKVYWGSYSIVQATVDSINEILNTRKPYDLLNLLSGNDYPIKSAAKIHCFFTENPGRNFMEYATEKSHWWQQTKTRVTRYHLDDFHFKGAYQLQFLLNRLLPERRSPKGIEITGRSQWITITAECARYAIAYLQKNPSIRRFFRFTWGSDEIVFQTILYNSPFRDSIINNNYRYIDWSAGKSSPKLLAMEDADKMLNSDCLYARKFDMDTQPEIMDYLDTTF